MITTETSDALRHYWNASEPLARMHAQHGDFGARDLWLDTPVGRIHCDLHEAVDPRAVVIFQPGLGSYGRFYAPLGQALARSGFTVIAVDRPGHGWSEGARGDCSIGEAIELSRFLVDTVRAHAELPVVLAGSSLGGLIVGFSLIQGVRPDLAIAHNFVMPGRLASMRLRAWFASRLRRRHYRVASLAKGFKGISGDPALLAYLAAQDDPQAAWKQSVRSVTSLFGWNPKRPPSHAPLVVLTGSQDKTIPPRATRWFTRRAGLKPIEFMELPGAGHMLFHDHLGEVLPLLVRAIEARLGPHRPATSSSIERAEHQPG